jgi:hypothetical protein
MALLLRWPNLATSVLTAHVSTRFERITPLGNWASGQKNGTVGNLTTPVLLAHSRPSRLIGYSSPECGRCDGHKLALVSGTPVIEFVQLCGGWGIKLCLNGHKWAKLRIPAKLSASFRRESRQIQEAKTNDRHTAPRLHTGIRNPHYR